MLRWRRYVDPLGARGLIYIYWQPWDDDDPKPTLAQGGFEVVAQLLAEPLRRQFSEHVDRCTICAMEGPARCSMAEHLLALLPAGDRVTIG